MKPKTTFSTTILALAGVALAASPSAQAALTYNNGDIFAGFRAVSGTGGTNDYIITLGSISQFQTGGPLADGTIHDLGLPNLGTDLLANFGNGTTSGTAWFNRADFLFSVFGVVKPTATFGSTSYSNQTMFWSDAEPTPGTQSVAQKGFATGALTNPTNNMVQVGSTYAAATPSSGETQAGGLLQAISNPGTYGNTTSNFSGAAYPNNKYFTLTPFKEPEVGFGAGTPQVVDLWQLNPNNTNSSTTLIGGFEIDNTGNISFSSDIAVFAVPEPASIGLLTSGLLVLVGRRRRAART